MSFSTLTFLFLFFPVVLAIYYLIPIRSTRIRTFILLLFSLVFYAWGDIRYLPLLLLSVLFNYLTGQEIALCRAGGRADRARIALIAAVIFDVAVLAVFKYSNLAQPIGISFYTFSALSYVFDIYMERAETDGDLLHVAFYILFFPKLLSGPIAEPWPLLKEMWRPKLKKGLIDESLQEFIIGLAYKVILADHLGGVMGKIRMRTVQGVSVQLAWLGILCYGLQLYFDFCGYSRMAIGIAGMLGIRLPENFRHPYCSRSIREFWRRWHITLGTWFRNHIYIPLGGSRNGAARMVLATLVVWLLTGIWHGAGWNFVCWGLTMFVLLMGEYFIWGKALERVPVIGHIYVPVIIMLSWIFFITTGPAEAGHYFLRLFGVTSMPFDAGDWKVVLSQCWMYLAPAIVFATPLPQMLFRKVSKKAVGWVILAVVFVASIFFMSTAASEPFLYFSF